MRSPHRRPVLVILSTAGALFLIGTACARQVGKTLGLPAERTAGAPKAPFGNFDDQIQGHARRMMEDGQRVFRHETFGSEDFWGGQLGLHRTIGGEKHAVDGVGKGLTPKEALALGLKVDLESVPRTVGQVLQTGHVNLDDPGTTITLLKADAVVGVKGFFDGDKLKSIGIECSLCHSTVDDSFAPGIGRRLDGWPNRDLDVGKIAASAPTLSPFAKLLGISEEEVRTVLLSWGPGRYDAELNQDGKAFRPDGKTAATVLPAAFGLAGVNLATYTGWGSVTYWNAYVANTQMHGKGTLFDPRIAKKDKQLVAGKEGDDPAGHFPVGARAGFDDIRPADDDKVTAKLAALHFYQLAIPAPNPPKGSFDGKAAKRGETVFNGKAKCATCHVPPLFTEPGWSMHEPSEICIDAFQANRSPDGKYRTTPLKGLFTRAKGGFYHDGRFEDLPAVISHYDACLNLGLAPAERDDLVQYLKSL